MDFQPLPFLSPLPRYEEQAGRILEGHRAADPPTLDLIHHRHPRFLDDEVRWLPKRLSADDIRSAVFDLADARLTLARCYDFQEWEALSEHVNAVTVAGSPVYRFESAVEAVITGDLAALGRLLRDDRDLVHARSRRVTHFDPPVHRATLLHYVAANGVEGWRQKTPPNAVEVAVTLLENGADVDSLADLYGGQCTTMSLLVSSCHPAEAGLQAALVDTLLDFGAAIEGHGSGNWISPLKTALVFGYRLAAEALVRRGARIDELAVAAGLGRLDDSTRLLPAASPAIRRGALALAAQLGHADVVRLLLDAGEDPNQYNPEGHHAHSTPLHQAALAGHEGVVRLLLQHGARLDIQDKLWRGTPLGWAIHGGRKEVEAILRAAGTGP